jgi:hypothetical protein
MGKAVIEVPGARGPQIAPSLRNLDGGERRFLRLLG